MKVIFIFLLISTVFLQSFSQNQNSNNYIKLSAGRVLFGTGDVAGFSINFEGTKNVIKIPRKFVDKLLIGAEFSFENGVKNPVIQNPTSVEFIETSFNHVSNSILSGKISYYPFHSLFKGFNISIGPSIGYTFFSRERSSDRYLLYPGEYIRRSILLFDNKFIFGYRVSTGYEFGVSRRTTAGFRLDFASYDNGDINTLAALKVGYNF